jgi:ATP:ADP antiporter, AAA family
MSLFIQKTLDIEKEEVVPVVLLLANSFFIGVFLVSYDVAASTIFLNTFGKEYLTRLPIFTGILGMFSTSIFAYFQRKVSFYSLTIFCFTLLTCMVVFQYVSLKFYHIKEFEFIAYLLLGPINAIFILCFYGTVSRSFSLKREKHLTGTVDQGQMIATAIAYFIVPIVSQYITDIVNFFVATIISGILAVVFIQLFFRSIKNQRIGTNKNTEKAKLKHMVTNPYIRMLSLLFFTSVLATIFLEYSFLSSTVEKYKDESEIASFLGIYGGLVTVFSVIFQTFVAGYVIKNYGMRVSLLLIPVVLGVFTVGASLLGTFFGYTAESSTFIFFFLFMAMSKLFLQSLKESFEDPILRTLFIPLESKTRFDVQTKIEGFFKEFSAFIAGALLTVLGFLSFFDLIFYSYFLAIVCVAYFYVTINLFLEYRKSLVKTLEVRQSVQGEIIKKDYEVKDVLLKKLQSDQPKTVIFSLKLMEKIEPILAEKKCVELLSNHNAILRKYAISRLEVNVSLDYLNEIKQSAMKDKELEVRQLALKAVENLELTDAIEISPNFTYTLAKSKSVADRLKATQLIVKTKDDLYLPHLMLLLRDSDARVRFSAMIAAAKMKRHETWSVLIEHLSSYTFCNIAAASLITFGESVLSTLEAAFYKTGQSANIQEKIVQIYGRIQGKTVIELLWNKINFPDKKIVNNVLMCLSSCEFRPDEARINRIKQAIEVEIGNSAWNIAAITEIEKNEKTELLRKALDEEIDYNFENIYMLLALIYDPQSVNLVKENIQSGTVEGIVFAVELLDVFLDEELKPIFFPLIEDITQEQRNELLQGYFPRQRLDKIEVLIQIINRDYNQINKWTKACALYAFAFTDEAIMCQDLIANLFNPDPLLMEMAAWVISVKDKENFHLHTNRLHQNIKKELEIIAFSKFNVKMDGNYSRFEKIFFLKSMPLFSHIKGVVLVEFVSIIEEIKVKANEIILPKNASEDAPFLILVQGKAAILDEKSKNLQSFYPKDIIGSSLFLATDKLSEDVIASENCTLFSVDKNRLLEQLADNFEITNEIIDVISV